MKARHKDTGEIIQLAEEGIISSDGRKFCWYQVELIPEPIDEQQPEVDLEEEMQEEYYKYAIYESGSISGEGYQLEAQGHYECNLTRKEFNYIARHFFELGLKARGK